MRPVKHKKVWNETGGGGDTTSAKPRVKTCQLLRSDRFGVCCQAKYLLRRGVGGGPLLLPRSQREGQERSSTLHKDQELKSHSKKKKKKIIIIRTQSSSASPTTTTTTTTARFAATKTNNVKTNAQWQIHKCDREKQKNVEPSPSPDKVILAGKRRSRLLRTDSGAAVVVN